MAALIALRAVLLAAFLVLDGILILLFLAMALDALIDHIATLRKDRL